MTYSLLARCARTGRFGLAVASYSLAVGATCEGALRPNVGVTLTQGGASLRNHRVALDLLAQGHRPAYVMRELAAGDPRHDWRQIAIVDREGAIAVHSGAGLRPVAAHRVGTDCVAMGCMLAGEQVVDALRAAFEGNAQVDLEERLLAALEAARDAGGLRGRDGPLPERSVALIVWGRHDYSDVDLRVDLHPGAIAELRRITADFLPSLAYYEERARNPRAAINAMAFAEALARSKAGGAP